MGRKRALGRGLKALIPEVPQARAGLVELPVDAIRPNPGQPRTRFDEEALRELADSIREHGVIQPLLVSDDGSGRYVLVAGERRLRAARMAGLATVPAVVRERLDGRAELELALVENLQRRDLTPIEEARAFAALGREFGLSQREIAERVGVDRSTVANALRLLKLPEEVQELVETGRLTAGHARALLALPRDEMVGWAWRAVEAGLSVRELERAAARRRPARRAARPVDPNVRAAEERLTLRLGAPVRIRRRRRGAVVEIHCRDDEELERLYRELLEGGGDGAERG